MRTPFGQYLAVSSPAVRSSGVLAGLIMTMPASFRIGIETRAAPELNVPM